jgi:hypothetical protein
MNPVHRVRRISVGLSKAIGRRFTVTVILATVVAIGSAGCLLVPFPIPTGGGHGHGHHRR